MASNCSVSIFVETQKHISSRCKIRKESCCRYKLRNMLGCCRVLPAFPNHSFRRGFCCRAEDQQPVYTERQNKKKVVVVGSGWAGLGAANHLCKQVLTIFHQNTICSCFYGLIWFCPIYHLEKRSFACAFY